jgi:enediyne biosynthesis protein E4
MMSLGRLEAASVGLALAGAVYTVAHSANTSAQAPPLPFESVQTDLFSVPNSYSNAWADFDNDGDLDLYVVNKLRGLTFSEFGLHAPDYNMNMGGFRDPGGNKMPPLFQADTEHGQLNGEFVTVTDPVTGKPRGEGRNTLYRNMLKETGKATFVDVTDQAGEIGGTSAAMPGGRSSSSVAVADVDGDGYLDVYVANTIDPDFWNFKGQVSPTGGAAANGENLFCNGETNRLYHNNGDWTFTDVTESAGVQGASPSFFDYGGAQREAYTAELRDAAGKPVGEPGSLTWGVAFSDIDGDGDPDLWLANDTPGRVELFRNDSTPGHVRFTAIGDLSGVGLIGQWMGIATGDFDRDGDFDAFITNYGGNPYLHTHNVDPSRRRLEDDVAEWHRWQNNASLHGYFRNDGTRQVRRGGAAETIGIFPNTIQALSIQHSRWLPPAAADPSRVSPQKRILFGGGPLEFGWGVVAFDADDDGWLDLYFAGSLGVEENSGRLLLGDGPNRYVDLTVEAHALDILGANYANVDAGQPPAPGDRILQTPQARTNEMAGAIASADLNGDGHEDLMVVNTGGWFDRRPTTLRLPNGRPAYQPGNVMIFINEGTPRHWLRVRLEGARRPGEPPGPGKSNRMGIGARVTAVPAAAHPPLPIVRELTAGGSFQAQSGPELHFGLGEAAGVSRLEVRWPSGRIQEFRDVPADRTVLVREGVDRLEVVAPKAKVRGKSRS